MSISIPSALEVLASAKETIAAFARWRQVTRGNAWALIDEKDFIASQACRSIKG
jgi:hypothetical protein